MTVREGKDSLEVGHWGIPWEDTRLYPISLSLPPPLPGLVRGRLDWTGSFLALIKGGQERQNTYCSGLNEECSPRVLAFEHSLLSCGPVCGGLAGAALLEGV